MWCDRFQELFEAKLTDFNNDVIRKEWGGYNELRNSVFAVKQNDEMKTGMCALSNVVGKQLDQAKVNELAPSNALIVQGH